MPTTDAAAQSRRILVSSLIAGGAVMVAVGIVVGIWQGPAFFLIAALGLIDFALAWAFASGRLGISQAGGPPAPDQQASGSDVAAPEATDDPSYNPYARED